MQKTGLLTKLKNCITLLYILLISHSNGLKFVKSQSRPLDPIKELAIIKNLAEEGKFGPKKKSGIRHNISEAARESYINKLLTFVDPSLFRDYKVVVNSGNGAAGPTFDCLKNKWFVINKGMFDDFFSEFEV